MIKQGDKFSANDLTASLKEVCNYKIIDFAANKQCAAGVIIGQSPIIPVDTTPYEYKDVCLNENSTVISSAQNLDKQLRERGLKTTYKFAYTYKTGGLAQNQIINAAYCLEWFYQIWNTVTPKQKFEQEYFNAIDDAFRLTYYYAQYLWAQNPRICGSVAKELWAPDASRWKQITAAILGIGYGFHPDDVYEFAIKHINPNLSQQKYAEQYDEQMQFKNKMKNVWGIDTGCLVLSLKNQEKLEKIVTKTDIPYCVQVIKKFFSPHIR